MRQFLRIVGITLAFLAFAWLSTTLISGVGSSLFGEWQLVFLGLEERGPFWALALICAGCVAAIAALFRYEQQLISMPLGISLLTLRLLLVLILFLTLLSPIWTWSYDRTKTGRVLLAVDVSESMDTIDVQATDVENIRWAEAVGMLGSQETRGRVRSWIQAWEAGREPEWVTAEESPDPERRERLAKIRRDTLQSQIHEISKFSRLEIARRAIAQSQTSPLATLQKLVLMQFSAFGESSVPLVEQQLQTGLDPQTLGVGRMHSNLAEAAEAARDGSSTAPLAAVILLSDGHDTDSPQSPQLTERLQALGVPIHTVLIGSEHRPRDLSIVHIDRPESVFLKDQPLVKSILQTSGFEGQSVKVTLEDLDDPTAESQEQSVVPQGPSAEVAFSLKELDVGRHRFRLQIEKQQRETRDDNNSSDFSISVVDDRARVLMLDGDARWEFRFLNDALSRDERISVDQVLYEQPFLGVLRKPFFPTRLEDLPLPEGAGTPFMGYDIVLIGDVSPQNLNAQRWQQLDRYVREEGGTLVLTAGKKYFPFAFQGTLADALLPVEKLQPLHMKDADQLGPPPQRGFHLSITADGEQYPMFQLDADPLRSRRVWQELPGHAWGIVGTARGGASVWATATMANQPVSLEQERQRALIAQHYVGTGQVVWIGIDSSWRWRYRVGDLYHHRFWGQLIRWAVSFKADAGNDALRLGLREAVIRAGQPAVIQARWEERFFAQHPHVKLTAVLQRQGPGPPLTQKLELAPRTGNSLIQEGQALGLPAGEYSVRLDITGMPDPPESPEVMLVVNAELTPELQDVSANRGLMEEIAEATAGRFLQLNELDQLPPLFQDITEHETIREEVPLYSHWVILLLFSSVAMAEWVIRKLNGLP